MDDCAKCSDPEFDHDHWAEEQMAKYGWYCHFVPHEDVVNSHTHGFDETFNHLDVQILFALNPHTAQGVFSSIVNLLKEGKRFAPGRFSGIIRDYQIEFALAEEAGRTVLRCLLPDKEGKFPGDPDCSELFKKQAEGILAVV